MTSLFNNFSFIHYKNLVRINNSRKSMWNNNNCNILFFKLLQNLFSLTLSRINSFVLVIHCVLFKKLDNNSKYLKQIDLNKSSQWILTLSFSWGLYSSYKIVPNSRSIYSFPHCSYWRNFSSQSCKLFPEVVFKIHLTAHHLRYF